MTIPRAVLDDVIAHARDARPRECCGILIGGHDHVEQSVRARNLAADDHRFLIDPADHIAARRTARARGLDVVGFYHSHPDSDAYPSETDVAEASYDDAAYLIVGKRDEARVFRLREQRVEELPLKVQ